MEYICFRVFLRPRIDCHYKVKATGLKLSEKKQDKDLIGGGGGRGYFSGLFSLYNLDLSFAFKIALSDGLYFFLNSFKQEIHIVSLLTKSSYSMWI